MKRLYVLLAILGTIVPYTIFVFWLVQHGLDFRLFVRDMFERESRPSSVWMC